MFLQKLELQGFKSFAHKNTLEFKRGIAAIVGPNGSGKCVDGNTIITLHDGEQKTIRSLVEEAISNSDYVEENKDGYCAYLTKPHQILSINPKSLEIEHRPVAAYIKRRAPAHLIRITTRAGRSITATPYHPLFTLRNGAFTSLRADELTIGTPIALPRILSVKQRKQTVHITDKEMISSFSWQDLVYAPYTPELHAFIARGQQQYGSMARFAAHLNIPETRLKGITSQQAVHVTAIGAIAEKMNWQLPPLAVLKSKVRGHTRLPHTLTEELARFLGYIIAEGRVNTNGQIRFVNDDPALIDDFIAIGKKLFNLRASTFSYKGRTKDVILYSKTLARYCDRIFQVYIAGKSAHKEVPPQIFQSPNNVIAAFLAALFDGDGYVATRWNTQRKAHQLYIEYATASKKLAGDIVHLLLRFGIVTSIRAKKKCATNTKTKIRRTYYSVYIYGIENLKHFTKNIPLRGRKKEKLALIHATKSKGNPNYDLIPNITSLLNTLIRNTATPIKPLRKKYPSFAAYAERRCNPSRRGLKEALMIIRRYGKHFTNKDRQLLKTLDGLVSSHLYWDPIVRIEKITGKKWVYDLSIEKTHNFVANDIIAHNSNIADAIRWVLGEQSMKMLRGKKSEDIIFSGSDKKARLGFTEVSLYLNNEDHKAPIDYSEIVITRRLFRDGESEYLINKNKVRLADILMLLAKSHFGQKTYSIIGQGMVDTFLNTSPAEKKEFIEEAAGVKQYQLKKEQAINKLKASQANLRQAEALLEEISPRLRSLTRQVRRLERREEVEKGLRELQKQYYGERLKELDLKMKKQKKRLVEAQDKRAFEEKEIQSVQAQLNGLEKEQIQSGLFLELQKEYERLLEEKNKLKEKEFTLKNKLAYDSKQTKRQIAIPTDQILKELDELLNRLSKIAGLNQLEIIKKEINNLSQEINQLIKKFRPTEEKTDAANIPPTEFKKLQEELNKVNEKLQEIHQKIANFSQEENEKKKKFFNLQHEFQTKQNSLNALTSEVNEIKIELARLETQKDGLASEMHEEVGEKIMKVIQQTTLTDENRLPNLGFGKEMLIDQIHKLKYQLELIGGIDPESTNEYQDVKERHVFLSTQSQDLRKAIKSLDQVIEELNETIKKQFDATFHQINEEFQKYFKILFGGGRAEIIKMTEDPLAAENIGDAETAENAADQETPAEILPNQPTAKRTKGEKIVTGVEIQATPPGKRLKNINMLSGGERALTSIALICAIISNNPSPFVVLDEADAALDEANSERFARILDELSHKTQFIVITHNRATMQKASILYGVTMGDDSVSKLLSVNLEQAEKVTAKLSS